jgi:hypothetical protein
MSQTASLRRQSCCSDPLSAGGAIRCAHRHPTPVDRPDLSRAGRSRRYLGPLRRSLGGRRHRRPDWRVAKAIARVAPVVRGAVVAATSPATACAMAAAVAIVVRRPPTVPHEGGTRLCKGGGRGTETGADGECLGIQRTCPVSDREGRDCARGLRVRKEARENRTDRRSPLRAAAA